MHCSKEKLSQFLPEVFKPGLLPQIGDFDVPVVPFHRNAMSTAFDKWLDLWRIDTTNVSRWTPDDLQSEIGTIGSMPCQQAAHLKHFIHLSDAGLRLWRARGDYVGSSEWDCQPLQIEKMGHNPACPASRLNGEGEVVLYTAETERTALAEIRPGRGYICTTSELRTTKDLRILDFASPPTEINPFTESQLTWKLDLRRLAKNLSRSIAQPTSRGEDSLVYGRTQYLARLARTMGLDGIRFSSSLDSPSGVNLALFDPSAVTFTGTSLVTIASTKIEYERVESKRPV